MFYFLTNKITVVPPYVLFYNDNKTVYLLYFGTDLFHPNMLLYVEICKRLIRYQREQSKPLSL